MQQEVATRAMWLALFALGPTACGGGGDGPKQAEGRGEEQAPGPAAPEIRRGELSVDGVPRAYRWIAPASAPGGSLPLIVVLHGGGAERDGTVMAERWQRLHGKAVALAFPDAADGHWEIAPPEPAPPAPEPPPPPEVDPAAPPPPPAEPPPPPPTVLPADVRFLAALVDAVVAAEPVDPRRVFLVGYAEGAALGWQVFCADADRYAGFGLVSQGMVDRVAESCAPSRGKPVLYFHGTADYLFNGGILDKLPGQGEAAGSRPPNSARAAPREIRFLGAEETVTRATEVMGCGDGRRTDTTLPDSSDDGTRVSASDWPACTSGGKLRFFRIEGGGRAWPGSRSAAVAPRFRATTDIDALDEITTYFGLSTE